jgi:putative SOS response-associated peptidase YedK
MSLGQYAQIAFLVASLEHSEMLVNVANPAKPSVVLLRPFLCERMHTLLVSDRVGNVRNNEPALLEPLART